jgi:adenylate cyclase, class 2
MALETEVKIYLAQPELLPQKLAQIGAILSKPRVFERNIRYENDEGSMTPNNIVLRLRQDDRGRITYKESSKQQASAGTTTRMELETEIGDIEVMDAILQKLGFHPHMVYEKYRTTYELGSAEIVFDEMPYGNFVEVEGEAEDIEQIIVELELAHAPRIKSSYVTLFETVKAQLGLNVRNLSFENFAGIRVPPELFR